MAPLRLRAMEPVVPPPELPAHERSVLAFYRSLPASQHLYFRAVLCPLFPHQTRLRLSVVAGLPCHGMSVARVDEVFPGRYATGIRFQFSSELPQAAHGQ